MEQNKEAKRLLLDQSCSSCIWRNNPYRLLTMWCMKQFAERDWCDCWITHEVDISGFCRSAVVNSEDMQLFKGLIKRRLKDK